MLPLLTLKTKLMIMFAAFVMFQCCCCIFPLTWKTQYRIPNIISTLQVSDPVVKDNVCRELQGDKMYSIRYNGLPYYSQDDGHTWQVLSSRQTLPVECYYLLKPEGRK